MEKTKAVLKGYDIKEGDEGIYEFHAPALRAFLACDNQWRVIAGFSGVAFMGLDYAACDVSVRRAGLDLTPDQWSDFQVIERAANTYQNKGDPLRDWQKRQEQEVLQ